MSEAPKIRQNGGNETEVDHVSRVRESGRATEPERSKEQTKPTTLTGDLTGHGPAETEHTNKSCVQTEDASMSRPPSSAAPGSGRGANHPASPSGLAYSPDGDCVAMSETTILEAMFREALERIAKQTGDSAQYPWCKSCGTNVRRGYTHGDSCPCGIAARALAAPVPQQPAARGCRQHADCDAADVAHVNASGEYAAHGSLIDQVRATQQPAGPAGDRSGCDSWCGHNCGQGIAARTYSDSSKSVLDGTAFGSESGIRWCSVRCRDQRLPPAPAAQSAAPVAGDTPEEADRMLGEAIEAAGGRLRFNAPKTIIEGQRWRQSYGGIYDVVGFVVRDENGKNWPVDQGWFKAARLIGSTPAAAPVERDEPAKPCTCANKVQHNVPGRGCFGRAHGESRTGLCRFCMDHCAVPSPASNGARFHCKWDVDPSIEGSDRTVLTIVGLNEADLIAGARSFLADRAAQPSPRCDCGDECSGRCAEARAAQPSDTAGTTPLQLAKAKYEALVAVAGLIRERCSSVEEAVETLAFDAASLAPHSQTELLAARIVASLPPALAAAPPVGHAPVAEMARGSLTLEEHLSLMRTREREALAERDAIFARWLEEWRREPGESADQLSLAARVRSGSWLEDLAALDGAAGCRCPFPRTRCPDCGLACAECKKARLGGAGRETT